MNKKLLHPVGAALVLLLLTGVPLGCSTAGAKFDTDNVSKLVKGTTTKVAVRNYFGTPLRTEQGPAGEVWTYTYVETHTTAVGALGHVTVGVEQSKTNVHMLSIIFAGEVVTDFRFSDGTHTDSYLPFQ